jgi:predicted RNA-binding protein YlqC (UPF0109 family)
MDTLKLCVNAKTIRAEKIIGRKNATINAIKALISRRAICGQLKNVLLMVK